ncbi:hypothetical protein [Pseudomonas sp. 6D_7.1_Bac1]|jgi:hypothetical protein|uniref:hypothetical protein n=1 Tax=Pseudomonas sp. 6D_7.1_Bac1 TaxID=2971615 RepID=UPI0021CAD182|nr:hypothetical protein [Pseudomonas sp. 6D_7.1_Bac1]MCU1750249.1 hypothetical protein [Pseudomonas sp. 6D_7.1_Bac1]
MIRSDLGLYALALLLILLHAGYSALERQRPYGSYFSHGVVLLENGESLTQSARLQFQKNMIYDYQQIGSSSSILPLEIKSSVLGSFDLKTTSTNESLNRVSEGYINSQIAYNQVYYSKKNMPLTFHQLPTEPGIFCAYIDELQKLRCFSMTH